jgi:hypothetical protein
MTRVRIRDLTALADQLKGVSARLADAPAAGPCGADCPCATVAPERLTDRRTLIPLTQRPPIPTPVAALLDGPAIACSLDGAAMGERVAQWQAISARASVRNKARSTKKPRLTGASALVKRGFRLWS